VEINASIAVSTCEKSRWITMKHMLLVKYQQKQWLLGKYVLSATMLFLVGIILVISTTFVTANRSGSASVVHTPVAQSGTLPVSYEQSVVMCPLLTNFKTRVLIVSPCPPLPMIPLPPCPSDEITLSPDCSSAEIIPIPSSQERITRGKSPKSHT
jgi:hypothetical protein